MSDAVTEEQLAELHPLAILVILRCDQAGKDPNLALEEEEIGELRGGLEELYGTEELRHAVKSLLSLGGVLGEQGCPVISNQLLELLAEQPLLDALDEINRIREEKAQQNSEKFNEFTGKETNKAAPQPGDERPEGALTLDKLNFPKRL